MQKRGALQKNFEKHCSKPFIIPFINENAEYVTEFKKSNFIIFKPLFLIPIHKKKPISACKNV